MTKQKKGLGIHGWLVLDKPEGMTSTYLLNQVKYTLNAQKAGHAGTLDPFATGILPIALGEATKTVPFMMDADKEYEFTLEWGFITDSLDITGRVIQQQIGVDLAIPDQKAIIAILPEFIGLIDQMPPDYSALKVNGQRAYDLARRGEVVELRSRLVRIDKLTLLSCTEKQASFYCRCGKGTYIRSLVRDIASRLGALATTVRLRRLRVGSFSLSCAILLEEVEFLRHKHAVSEKISDMPDQADEIIMNKTSVIKGILPIDSALDGILAIEVSDMEAAMMKRGQALTFIRKIDFPRIAHFAQDQLILIRRVGRLGQKGHLIGWGTFKQGRIISPKLLQL